MKKRQVIRLNEAQLKRMVAESVKRVLMEDNVVDINRHRIDMIKKMVKACGGYVEVADDDIEDMQVYDGGFDGEGESHGIVSMNGQGCEMDNEDFYTYEDLMPEDLILIIDYLKWDLKRGFDERIRRY